MADYSTDQVDVLVIGAGQNGLIAADYLKQAGLSVMVMERRLESGGGLTGEEPTITGFWHVTGNPFQDTASILPFMEELQLAQFNGRWIVPEVQSALPLSDGRSLVVYADLDRTLAGIRAFSERDAARWRSTVESFQSALPALRASFSTPNDGAALEGTPFGHELRRLRGKTPLEALDEYFESDAVKALVTMHLAAPRGIGWDYEGAGAIVPLAIGLAAENRLQAGGVHELAQALWTACVRGDGDVWDSTAVTRILIENGRAVGVDLATGRQLRAKAVISSVDLETTFLDLLGEDAIPADLAEQVKGIERDEYSVFSVHLALREPPRFASEDVSRAFRINLGIESLVDVQRLWDQVRRRELPSQPALMVFTTATWDGSQAPAGQANTTIWQIVPRRQASGDWIDVKDRYARELVDRLRRWAPNVTDDRIYELVAVTPHDYQQKWPSLRPGLFGGKNAGRQLLESRPFPDLRSYRTPIPGLYVCNASIAPGAGLVGLQGYATAKLVAEDLGATIAVGV